MILVWMPSRYLQRTLKVKGICTVGHLDPGPGPAAISDGTPTGFVGGCLNSSPWPSIPRVCHARSKRL